MLSQQEMADSLGITQAGIYSIEKGVTTSASIEVLRKMVIRHNVNPFYILLDSIEPPMLRKGGNQVQSLTNKVVKYEKHIMEMNKIMKGK
jgi:transcriptional regulator with XRE-family HTH domain